LGTASFPKILRRVAYPVEPLGFAFVENSLPPPVLDGIQDGLGEQYESLEQLDKGHADDLQNSRTQDSGLRSALDELQQVAKHRDARRLRAG
jgi:hypothetical protein